MRGRDFEDASGILQALQGQRMPLAQAAPEIAQVAGNQMGAMTPDFVNYLQNISQGQAPDFQKIYETRLAMANTPARPKEELNLKNLFNYISDVTASAAKANRENPRGGLLGAIATGSGGAYEKREAGHRAKHEGQKDILNDLQKIAEDQRKYNLELKKIESEAIKDKFNPVTGELIRFEHGRAVGGGGSGGMQGGGMQGGTVNVMPNQIGNSGMQQPSNAFLRTPKGQSELANTELDIYKQMQKENREFLKDVSSSAVKNEKQLTTLHQLEKTLPDFYQGLFSEEIHKYGKPVLSEKQNKAFEFFNSKANELALELSQNQVGAQSNADMERVSATKPSATNAEANKNIIESLKATAKRENEYSRAAKKFIQLGGSPEEFQNRWVQYANAFPITDMDNNGNLVINQDNLHNWEMIFEPNFENMIGAFQPINRMQEQPQQMMPQQGQENPFVNMTQEQRDAYRAKLQGKK